MSFKKTKVVLLSTNEKSKLVLSYNNELAINWTHDLAKFDDATYQNLYFLSDEEIKEGDWYIHNQKGTGLRVQQCVGTNLPMDSKKIIATTAIICTGYSKETSKTFNDYQYLPQPSQSFIQKFVEEYNKGNQITEVMVEYEEGKYNLDELRERHLKGLPHSYDYCNLKVNPKDNRIIIRKVRKFSEYVTDDLLKKAQKAILCNQKDAIMNENYILEYLQQYDRDL